MNKDRLYLESIHDYLKVNLARVWRTVITDLPPLRKTITRLLSHA
ncbi:MAG: HepT-like ribonuclease domain-containing protein [Cyanobacteriota bacterium]